MNKKNNQGNNSKYLSKFLGSAGEKHVIIKEERREDQEVGEKLRIYYITNAMRKKL